MITAEDLREIFDYPSVKEVAFELRFAPRLRVVPEVWRIQESLAEAYPTVSQENFQQPDGRAVQTYVFANRNSHRLVRVSEENFIVGFNKYGSFEEFKAEALRRAEEFCRQFEIRTFHRVGLRYVNHIQLKRGQGISDLRRYVNLPVDFDRFDPEHIEQFLTEFRMRTEESKITIRGAFLQVPGEVESLLYVLDLDCYSQSPSEPRDLPRLLDIFHKEIQIRFLEHIKEDYKQVMRGKV